MARNNNTFNNLRVPYGLSVYDNREIERVVKVLKEHRSNMGIETREFEERVAKLFGAKFGIMVNSGSSANLLAIELADLKPGDEVITPVLTFSTTVSPLIMKGLIPVFVDVKMNSYQIDIDKIEKAISKKTKALMIPLLLGNFADLKRLKKIAKKNKLKLILDSCDTLGATYYKKPINYYADISTTSFFGSHIITAGGNGGMLLVNDATLRDGAKVLRGWGRSSSLFSESEDINKRFKQNIDGIIYDAKFIFQEVGYNLLPMEISAAFGNEQLNKLPVFKKRREDNFQRLLNFFSKYQRFFILPQQIENSQTQWISFPLIIKQGSGFDRIKIVTFLEKNNIQTRPIFTGNILRQPGFKNVRYRKAEKNFPVADEIMKRGFVVGCHHGLEIKHLEKLEKVFESFLKNYAQ